MLAGLTGGCGSAAPAGPDTTAPFHDAVSAAVDAADAVVNPMDAASAQAETTHGQDADATAVSPPVALCLTATEATYAKDALATQALVAAGDGHLLLGGSTYFIEKDFPAAGAWAVRVDAAQKLVWQRDLRKDEQWRRPVYGTQLDDKSLVLAGYSDGALAEGGSFFVPVPRVIKLTAEGKTLWSKAFPDKPVQARFVAAKSPTQLQIVGAHAGQNDKVWVATLDATTGATTSQLDVPIANFYYLTDIVQHASGAIGIAAMSNALGAGNSYHMHALFAVIDPATATVQTQVSADADTVTAGVWATSAGFAVVTSMPQKTAWVLQNFSSTGVKGTSLPLAIAPGWVPSLAVAGQSANLHLLLEQREPNKVFALSHRWTLWTPAAQLLADTVIDAKIGSPWTGGVVHGDDEVVLLGPWDTYSTGSSEATNVVSQGAKVARLKTTALPCK